MRDAVELEWSGIPSVAIVHQALSGSGQAITRISGMAGYRFVTVDYPHTTFAMWTDEEIDEVAGQLAPRIVEILTTDQDG